MSLMKTLAKVAIGVAVAKALYNKWVSNTQANKTTTACSVARTRQMQGKILILAGWKT